MLEPIKINKEEVSLRYLIEDCLFMFNLQIEMKELKVLIDVDASVPDAIESDPMRLQQILNNLISNATKFADDFSAIEVTATYLPESETLKISVSNFGIIIEDKERRSLFKRYKTLKSAKIMGYAGSGLGLYIARSLCQTMGGDLELQNSCLKQGPTEVGHNIFTATIKAKKVVQDTRFVELLKGINLAQIEFRPIVDAKILIFEDQAYSLIALKELMHNDLGLKPYVHFYSSGSAIANALRKFFEERSENQVAIILIDFNMPGMNGVDLIKWTRGFYKANLP